MQFAKLASAALAATMLIFAAAPALAQAAPPVGFWVTRDGSEQLLITQNGQCSLADRNGRPTTSGSCSWNSSSRGGILTIMSQQLYRPAPIYFNVVWVDQNTISVEGDIFYRRAG
jgi:hypothetical protein